jgi:spermidine synthase
VLRLSLIAPLFVLSGGTALLYQVAFGKQLSTIFGATAYAVSAVLAAFMGGLALGSHLGGKYSGRVRRPLVVYGAAEIVVALVCAVTPWLFDAVAVGYVGAVQALPASLALVSGVRAVMTATVVMIPTIAMGITLPMLARAIAGHADERAEASRRRLAQLYAINTAGGASGALLAAYFVLPVLGVYSTMRAAALVNLAIGVIAIGMGRRADPVAALDEAPLAAEAPASVSEATDELLLIVLAVASGLLVFAAEVVDTHLLALLIGNSAYAFGLMLAAFLTCLSLGAALAQPIDRRFERSALSVSLMLTAVALVLSLPLWSWLPNFFLGVGHRVSSWAGREAVRAAAAFGVLFIPTVCMGLTFPLLLRRVASLRDVGRRVGRLTAINTVGAICGSLICGYFILPVLGSEWMLRAIAIGFAAVALFAAVREGHKGARKGMLVAFVALLGVIAVMPRWDMMAMTNGANVYFDTQPRPDELVFVREDVHGGLTSVARRDDVLTLYTNGKFQGDNGHEVVAQRSFAHFPALFVDNHGSVLVIGLGTGTTLGTIAGYPFERIHVAEISPSIVEAAGRYFEGPNRKSLRDPRVDLMLNDGRNVLLLAQQPYDLITIELTSVWFAGAANLYSAEFYQLCRDRMTAGGVLQQWVQLHHIRRREFAAVLRTLRHVFEHVALFVSGGQGILVASPKPLRASRERMATLSQRPEIAATLGKHGSLESLLSRMVLSDASLDRFVKESEADGGPILSTDNNLYLEYATPKGNVLNYDKSLSQMVDLLASYRAPNPLEQHLRD